MLLVTPMTGQARRKLNDHPVRRVSPPRRRGIYSQGGTSSTMIRLLRAKTFAARPTPSPFNHQHNQKKNSEILRVITSGFFPPKSSARRDASSWTPRPPNNNKTSAVRLCSYAIGHSFLLFFSLFSFFVFLCLYTLQHRRLQRRWFFSDRLSGRPNLRHDDKSPALSGRLSADLPSFDRY